MTPRVRRSTPCPHHPDVRDCGDCVAAAHRRAIAAAEVRLHAAPDRDAGKLAAMALVEAQDAQEGHRILRENGIAFIPIRDPIIWSMPCPRCGTPIKHRRGTCERMACPGRRVRCELPGVRR